MDQAKLVFSLKCPDHRAYDIGMLSIDPNSKKIGYCFQCLAENSKDGTLLQTLRTVPDYLEDKSSFFEKCRSRTPKAGEPPAEYTRELLKKEERLEKLSKHIDQEKAKVVKRFDDVQRTVMQIINEKKNECLKLLDKEIINLSEAYTEFEKLLMTRWPKDLDTENPYPKINVLKERISQIESMDQLQAFMSGIEQDIQIQSLYFSREDGISRIKYRADELIRILSMPESSLPRIQGQILNSENLEGLMKHLMKGFLQQEIQVESSTVSRMKVSTYGSKIIFDDQFEILKAWLPKGYKFDLRLLYRGSVDGMAPEMFHEKCDNKDATITLIKCRFEGAPGSKTIGGFLDQSWHSMNYYSSSTEAFLFSLTEQSHSSVKCPILGHESKNAFYGGLSLGPVFGYGNDLFVNGSKTVQVNPYSYLNSNVLMSGNVKTFNVEEIEVYQVR